MPSYLKDPEAKLDYGFDWSAWLATGETISGSTWDVPAGLTVVSNSHNGTTSSIWLSGGTSGVDYDITNHIVTSAAREDDRTMKIKVRPK